MDIPLNLNTFAKQALTIQRRDVDFDIFENKQLNTSENKNKIYILNKYFKVEMCRIQK